MEVASGIFHRWSPTHSITSARPIPDDVSYVGVCLAPLFILCCDYISIPRRYLSTTTPDPRSEESSSQPR